MTTKTSTRSAAALPAALLLALCAPGAARAAPSAATTPSPEAMTAQERDILALGTELARRCGEIIEKWLASNEVSEDRLFSGLYYPIPRTDPPKYRTDWDRLSDRDILPVEEAVLARSGAIDYAILVDRNGYCPTHNQRYSQPLTGNPGVDFLNNRTKRIFATAIESAAAHSTAPYLFRRYQRDDGQQYEDLAVPVMVRGRQFGGIRIGFRTEAR